MNTKARWAAGGERAPLVVSSDGYLRLTVAALRGLRLSHLMSALDAEAELSPSNAVGACVASITGYTEWVSHTRPALSLGWDWRIATGAGRVHYHRDGEVRSNLMLVDARRHDLGALATGVLLCSAVDSLEWKPAVQHFICHRNSHRHGHSVGRRLVNFTVSEIRSTLWK